MNDHVHTLRDEPSPPYVYPQNRCECGVEICLSLNSKKGVGCILEKDHAGPHKNGTDEWEDEWGEEWENEWEPDEWK